MTIGMTIMNGSGGAVNTDTHTLLHCSLFPSQYYLWIGNNKTPTQAVLKKITTPPVVKKIRSGIVGGAEILKKIVPGTRFNSYSIASQNQNVSYLISIQFNGTFGILNLKKVFSFVNCFFPNPWLCSLEGRAASSVQGGRFISYSWKER